MKKTRFCKYLLGYCNESAEDLIAYIKSIASVLNQFSVKPALDLLEKSNFTLKINQHLF